MAPDQKTIYSKHVTSALLLKPATWHAEFQLHQAITVLHHTVPHTPRAKGLKVWPCQTCCLWRVANHGPMWRSCAVQACALKAHVACPLVSFMRGHDLAAVGWATLTPWGSHEPPWTLDPKSNSRRARGRLHGRCPVPWDASDRQSESRPCMFYLHTIDVPIDLKSIWNYSVRQW